MITADNSKQRKQTNKQIYHCGWSCLYVSMLTGMHRGRGRGREGGREGGGGRERGSVHIEERPGTLAQGRHLRHLRLLLP